MKDDFVHFYQGNAFQFQLSSIKGNESRRTANDQSVSPITCYSRSDSSSCNESMETSVDWMVCDVAAYPVRIVELVGKWCKQKAAKRIVVTMKFQGPEMVLVRFVGNPIPCPWLSSPHVYSLTI